MLKEEGDNVKADELIATLDDRDYKSNFEKAKADEAKTFALSKDATSKYERNYPLCTDDTISKQECESPLNRKDRQKPTTKLLLHKEVLQKINLIIQNSTHQKIEQLRSECKKTAPQLPKDNPFTQWQKQNLSGFELM